jgi:tRNA 2-thiouridine synthesizing protein B
MLFIVNKSHALGDCVARACDGDVILLIENAVNSAVEIRSPSAFQALNANVSVYALQPDLLARGIDKARCYDFVKQVDYVGFVDLVEKNNPIRSCC